MNEGRVVQFPHPGVEHVPPGEMMPWNTGQGHKRKYLVSQGMTVDVSGATTKEGEVLFWGEWEPPSQVLHRWNRAAELPTVVHAPFWTSPGPSGGRQNTDPWVFGPAFLYSNCKQTTPTGSATALQGLPPGSVILFGSTLASRFVLDTVFVVGELVRRWTPADDSRVADEAFRACTIRSLASGGHAHRAFTLYRGATPAMPVDGMFSWVPCQPRTDRGWPRFRRPTILLPDIVNAASKRSPRGSKVARSAQDIRAVWAEVAEQTEMQGLSLGCGLRTPRCHKEAGKADEEGIASCSSDPPRTSLPGARC